MRHPGLWIVAFGGMTMNKKRRTYSREFKLKALRLWETTDKTAGEIEREMGIGDG